MGNIKNLRNYEILNENPKVVYVEGDYEETGLKATYGYKRVIGDTIYLIFNANMSEKVKIIYKNSCLNRTLTPNYEERIIVKEVVA